MMIGGRMVESVFDTMMSILPNDHMSNLATFDLLDRESLMGYSGDQNLTVDVSGYTIDTIFEDFANSKPRIWIMSDDSDDGGQMLNHDCMWSGQCGNQEHAEEPRPSLARRVPKTPVIRDVMLCPPLVVPKQVSLLKPSVKAQSVAAPLLSGDKPNTPQTPPESDDEENSTLLNLLKDAINECNTDLTAYFEGKEVKEEPIDIKEEPLCEPNYQIVELEVHEEANANESRRIRNQRAAANDHSYHKDMNAVIHMTNYGLETPSDSEEEEEIDVVSVTEKASSNASRNAFSLPTNPSRQDRHQWQKTVATAISKNGVKTILPVKSAAKPIANPAPTTGRRGGRKPSSPPAKASPKPKARNTRGNAKAPAKAAAKATAKANAKGTKRRRKNGAAQEPADKRSMHNDMERQRRVDLRYAFNDLLYVIPDVPRSKKVAKVNILTKAKQFSIHLTTTGSVIDKVRNELKARRRELKHQRNLLVRHLLPLHPDPSSIPPKPPKPPKPIKVEEEEDDDDDDDDSDEDSDDYSDDDSDV